MINNDRRMPSSATSMERLNRLREANSQWEGIPIGINGPRKKNEYLRASVGPLRTGSGINLFSLEAVVMKLRGDGDPQKWLKGY